jgi:hypothetical protein
MDNDDELPRQARDKNRTGNSKKRGRFTQGGAGAKYNTVAGFTQADMKLPDGNWGKHPTCPRTKTWSECSVEKVLLLLLLLLLLVLPLPPQPQPPAQPRALHLSGPATVPH